MKIVEEFNKYAQCYSSNSTVQEVCVKKALEDINGNLKNIADIGCGDGKVFKYIKEQNIKFNKFYAIDYSKEMLKLHPEGKDIIKIFANFNDASLYNKLKVKNLDTVISSSSLQWADNIDFVFKNLSQVSNRAIFSIFTSNTFRDIHNYVGVTSPIVDKELLISSFKRHYQPEKIEKLNFKLEFTNSFEMLKYIKHSGASGGVTIGFKGIKKILSSYPKKSLHFESYILIGESRC